jgi:hypothetical protein
MRDPMTFEDRLSVAVEAYAGQMPTDVDPLAMVRLTRTMPSHSLTWPRARSTALALVALIVWALVAVLVGLALSQRPQPQPLNRFVPTGSLHHDPAGTTAVLLSDGRVLVVGSSRDSDGETAPDSRHWSEIYSPSSGQFQESLGTPPMTRFTLTALTNGRVLMTGTTATSGVEERVPVAGTSLVLDPATSTAIQTRLITPRSDPVTALLQDGRVLVAGGYGARPDGTNGSIATAEVWDPTTGTSTPTGPMIQDRVSASAVTLDDGRVLVFGGQSWTVGDAQASPSEPSIEAEIYDPSSGSFNVLAPDPEVASDPIYVLKGLVNTRLERIDLVAGTVTDVTPFPDFMPLVQARDGRSPDPQDTDCTPGGRQCRYGYTIVPIDAHHALITGGRSVTRRPGLDPAYGAAIEPDQIVDPTTGVVTSAGPVIHGRDSPMGLRLADGRVLLYGGAGESAEIYEP